MKSVANRLALQEILKEVLYEEREWNQPLIQIFSKKWIILENLIHGLTLLTP